MTQNVSIVLVTLAILAPFRVIAEAEVATNAAAAAATVPDLPTGLPTSVVARIEGVDIPADWYVRDFRSMAFQPGAEEELREEVFSAFMRKATLYALAHKEGLLKDPRIRKEIDDRVAKQRALLEYQLAMTEVNIAVQAYLTLVGITPEAQAVTDAELEPYLERQFASQQGGPYSFDSIQVTDEVREQYRANLVREKHLAAILEHLALLEDSIDVEINQTVVTGIAIPPAGPGPSP